MPETIVVRPWQLVTSRAGRDAGEPYLVVAVGGDGFVSLANGERRRIESPKRKNARHLVIYDVYARDLATRSAAGQTVKNAEVRSTLQRLVADAGLASVEADTGPAGEGAARPANAVNQEVMPASAQE